jgi:lysophospholipase L1-like esterase
MILLLGIIRAGAQQDTLNTDNDTLVYEENYPEDIDLLEEIIQSYYLLLDSESLVKKYPMINQDANIIENDSLSMQGFYSKLAELRNGQKDRVTILQIGDSHIQPGYFSGTARSSLQRYFGNAGRGLVFPWRLARTNQPDDIRITSNSLWTRSSNEIGICGYGLQAQAEGNLCILTNNFFQTDNTFDQVTLIMKEQQNSYAWNATGLEDELTQTVSSFADQSIYQLSWLNPSKQVELSFKAADPADKANLYGIILERQQPGLFYHAMGVNGASFDRFSKIAEFFPQMRILTPDLIVISLGTNDTQGRFREEVYLRTVKQFMKQLAKAVPGVPVLFTFPPDSNKNGRTNQDIAKANQILSKYALENNYAWWNLQEVMGGSGSIRHWQGQGLARSDLKHFTPKGYMLQGQLFNQALVKGYKNYAEHK